jgi:hypothetical protein
MKTAFQHVKESYESMTEEEFMAYMKLSLDTLTKLDMAIIVKAYNLGKKDAYVQDDVPSAEEFIYQNFPKTEE